MRGAVIYESKWGKGTQQVAEKIAGGLRDTGHSVCLLSAGTDRKPEPGADFLVIGAPTKARGLPRPVRRYIDSLSAERWKGVPFASFGTGVFNPSRDTTRSADIIHRVLSEKGLRPVAPPFTALVTHNGGPVLKSELVRARVYGKTLGETLRRIEGGPTGTVTFLEKAIRTFYRAPDIPKRRAS